MSNRNNKTFFIKIIFLIILGALLWGGFSAFKSSGKKSLQLENGQNVTFTNADDNAGEDIIIRSDKAEYASVGQAEAYLSISAGKPEETLFLQFLFPDDGSVVEKVELKKGNGWKTILVSRGSVENEESGNITSALIRRKTIPDTHSSLGYISFPSANQAQYIKLSISYPPDATGEFWVEAFGILGSYGLLDPIYGVNNGLVGYWTFDGKDTPWTSSTAATTLDKSGNGNTGTLTNMAQATSPVAGKIGQALSFDGTDDYVKAPINLSSTNKVSVSFWLFWPAFANDDDLAFEFTSNSTAGPSTGGFMFDPNDSAAALVVYLKGDVGQNYATYTRPTANVWHYYTAIYDKSQSTNEVELYIDGLYQTPTGRVTNNNTNNFANDDLYFMSRGGTTLFGNGKLDDVRIYNRALSAAEVSSLYNLGAAKFGISPIKALTSGLVGWWTMDGKDTPWTSSTAATTLDKSGNSNTGTLTNMAQATSPVAGKIGQALSFDNSNDCVNLASPAVLDDMSAITMSAWIYPKSIGGSNLAVIVRKDGGFGTSGWRWIMSSGS